MQDNAPIRGGEPAAPARPQYTPSQSSTSHKNSKKPNKFKRILIIVIIVAVLVVAAVIGLSMRGANAATTIDNSKFQAVFFTNGQVYFGKLKFINNNYMDLTDIFYLQTSSTSTNPQQTSSSSSSDVQLIKLGSEVHGPEDEMVINRDQVLFFENLKPSGKVATSIASYKP